MQFHMIQLSNRDIKSIRALASKKFRDETGLFVVEGEKMVQEALDSRFEVTAVYRRDEIGEEAMSRISQLSSPSPVLAVVRKPSDLGEAPSRPGPGLYLALDSIRDPGNLGTILRIADWFGVKSVLASRDTVEAFNPKVVQATMGAIFRTRVDYVDLPQWLSACGMPVYGASLQGAPLSTFNFQTSTPKVLLIGNESRGISPEAMAQVTHPVLIPNLGGTAESLNAAVAAGILMYFLNHGTTAISRRKDRD